LDIWFPTETIFARGVKYSNMYIKQQNIMREGKPMPPLTLGEMYIAHSLMISMAALHGGPSEEYFWYTPKSVTPPQVAYDFGRYMPRYRYQLFKRAWHLDDNLSGENEDDPLRKLRWLLDLMQSRMKESVAPGKYLCVDETIIPWDGRGLPYRKSIDRKPHDGWFLWSVCGSSKIMLNFEVYDGTRREHARKWTPKFGTTVGVALRLTEPWHFKGHIVIGDRWFGGLLAVLALYFEAGSYSLFGTMTNRKRYPLDEVRLLEEAARGTFQTATGVATFNGQ
jgi:hypothetical protein